MKLKDLFQVYEKLGMIYFEGIFNRELYNKGVNDPLHALRHFIDGYAFERQGAPKQYKAAAHYVLDNLSNLNSYDINNIYKFGYDKFIEALRKCGVKNNNRNCIFDPEGSVLSLYIDSRTGHKVNLRSILLNEGINILYNRILKVKGVARKITSFYLRDLVFVENLDINGISPKMIQPVDVWVRKGIKSLISSGVSSNAERVNSDLEISKYIYKYSNKFNVHPSLVNAGIWFYGAKMAINCIDLDACFRDYDKIIYNYKIFLKKEKMFFGALKGENMIFDKYKL